MLLWKILFALTFSATLAVELENSTRLRDSWFFNDEGVLRNDINTRNPVNSYFTEWFESLTPLNSENWHFEYTPDNLSQRHLVFDSFGLDVLMTYLDTNNGILLVGGEMTVKLTIQMAVLLNAKHCSEKCDKAFTCSYCFGINQQHKLTFIRNDKLSLQCDKHSAIGFGNFCNIWASKDILSEFSVIILNNDYNLPQSAIDTAMSTVAQLTTDKQLILYRNEFISEVDCQQHGSDTDATIERKSSPTHINKNNPPLNNEKRIYSIDAFISSYQYRFRRCGNTNCTEQHLAYSDTRHYKHYLSNSTAFNTTAAEHKHHYIPTLAKPGQTPHYNTDNYVYREANLRRRKLNPLYDTSSDDEATKSIVTTPHNNSNNISRDNHNSKTTQCRSYNINNENSTALSDFLLLWSDQIYTTILLHFKSKLFSNALFLNETTHTSPQQQLTTLEFSILNYLNTINQLRLENNNAIVQNKNTTSKTASSNPRRISDKSTNNSRKSSSIYENYYSKSNTHDTVVLGVSDIAYAKSFTNWYNMTNIAPLHNNTIASYIVAIDTTTCEYLRSENRNTFCLYYSNSFASLFKQKGSDIKLAVGLTKVLFPLLFIQEFNMNVVMSESDIFWRGDPIQSDLQAPENQHYDIQVSSHVDFWPKFYDLNTDLNIGFYHVKPTSRSVVLFQDLLHYACAHSHQMATLRVYDQQMFDIFIRMDNVLPDDIAPWTAANRFDDWKQYVTANQMPVKYRRLPGALYTHNQGNLLAVNQECMTVHISWGINMPARRIYCASQIGWHPKIEEYEREFKGLDDCFDLKHTAELGGDSSTYANYPYGVFPVPV